MRFLLRWLTRLIVLLLALVLVAVLFYGKKDIPPETLISKYGNTQSKFMNLMGMNVHYRDEGNRNDSVPLVLLHGTASSLLTWDSTVILLGSQHRTIRFDLPGYGITGPNPTREYDPAFYMRFIDSVLIQLGVTHCVLAGNSLGGFLAWQYALAYPSKVTKLILVDAGGYIPKVKPDVPLAFKIAAIPVVKNLLKWITPRALVRKSVENVYFDKGRVTDQLVDQYWDLALRTGNRQALIDRMQLHYGNELSDKIPQITTPTLIIWGAEDHLIPVDNAASFHKDIRGSQLAILPNTGHVPMEETPQKFVQLLLPFLSSNHN
ncbi:MAG: alpha/beta hydrolase [Bacteroidota bacterium]